MENILKQMVNNIEPKRSFSIVVSDNKTRFKTWFKPLIQLHEKKDYDIALINLETYYSFPNTDRFNNCFTHSSYLDRIRFNIIIPEGNYHVEDINEFIQREMRKNGHYDQLNDKDYIEISANNNTSEQQVRNDLKNNYDVDFRKDRFINSLLRLRSKLYTSGFNKSEKWLIFLLSTAY